MPVIPSLIERLILRTNRLPGPLFTDLPAEGVFRTVNVAVKLGVFETLKDGPLPVAKVAENIGADERATTILLGMLEASGYIRRKHDRYSNTAMTRKWILRSSPTSVTPFFIDWWGKLVFPFWDQHLEESIREGKPFLTIYESLNQRPDGWATAQSAFAALAAAFGYGILDRVKLPDTARRLLDLGGGHGLYSIYFCRRYPELTATVFDNPEALESARENIAATEMAGQVSIQPGDFWKDSLGTGYDAVLLFNIIHAYLPEKNTELLRKVSGALNPKGLVVFWDQFAGRGLGPVSKAVERFLSLTFLVTMGGQTYSFEELSRWLLASGFAKPRHLFLRPIVLATKASET